MSRFLPPAALRSVNWMPVAFSTLKAHLQPSVTHSEVGYWDRAVAYLEECLASVDAEPEEGCDKPTLACLSVAQRLMGQLMETRQLAPPRFVGIAVDGAIELYFDANGIREIFRVTADGRIERQVFVGRQLVSRNIELIDDAAYQVTEVDVGSRVGLYGSITEARVAPATPAFSAHSQKRNRKLRLQRV